MKLGPIAAVLTVGVSLLVVLCVAIFLVLLRLGMIRMVPAADIQPIDLASLMVAASSLVVTGVGIAVAIGAFFGFEQLRTEAKNAGREAGEIAGRAAGIDAGQAAGAREASIAATVSDPGADEEGARIAAAQESESHRDE